MWGRKRGTAGDTAPDAVWEIWYQDTFDRKCPRRVEVSGRGLTAGLAELWARHLFETVRPDGKKGFSRFNLWWTQERRSVRITGQWAGVVRLRRWVFGERREIRRGYVAAADKVLLRRVAAIHGHLLRSDRTSEEILAAAASCTNRQDFEERLSSWERDILKGKSG